MGDPLPAAPIEPRVPEQGVYPLREIVPGLDELPVFESVSAGFDEEALWEAAHVVVFRGDGYPRVDDHTGNILCPDEYARTYEPIIVYLDLVHELVHVRQVMEGKQVYHFPDPYVRWPTEIEAYRVTYEEAKRVGLEDAWFWEYLAVPWVDQADLIELAESIGLPTEGHVAAADEEGARH